MGVRDCDLRSLIVSVSCCGVVSWFSWVVLVEDSEDYFEESDEVEAEDDIEEEEDCHLSGFLGDTKNWL